MIIILFNYPKIIKYQVITKLQIKQIIVQMTEDNFQKNFYDTSAFTADISTKMRIPEHIDAHGAYSNGEYNGKEYGKSNSALYDMQVPDR